MSDWEAELEQETPKILNPKKADDDDWENEIEQTETKVKSSK